MTHLLHSRRFRYLALAVVMTAMSAAAQDIPNVLVVVDTTEVPLYWDAYLTDPSLAYTNVQTAINDAVTLSRDTDEPYTVLIVARNNSAPWAGGVEMPADANVRILGESRTDGVNIFEPVLDGGGMDVITIGTTAALFENDIDNLNNPRVEGLRLLNGNNGIRVVGDNPNAYRPTINRCWMDSNANHGVSIEGDNARALLINCSISDNGADGVHVDTNPASTELITDILHCSIIGNGERGVWVNRSWTPASSTEPPEYARVRNTIVYQNGTAQSAESDGGGLVWSSGITIIPEYDVVTGGASAAIYGTSLTGAGGDTRVFFGPRDIGTHNPGVVFSPASDPDRIVGTIPPAYNSAPGKVDVHIVREYGTGDERTYTLQNAFTYVEDPAEEPHVTLVTPAQGPPEGGNWVLVEGVRFNVDGEVWFDFNGNRVIDRVGQTAATGTNGTVGPNSFAPYAPVPVWTPNQFRDYYLIQGATRWLIASNTVDTLFLIGSTAALADGAWIIARPADLLANERTWLSSALLHAKAPAVPAWFDPIYHNSGPMDVLVRNLYPTGAFVDSPAGDENMREYRYRGEDSTGNAGVRQPDIVQIVPNFYRRLNTDAPSANVFRVDILGWNFDSGCAVRIGGQMCSYASVSTIVSGLPEGDWRKIIDVQVPLAEFGAGGAYDVEVTNPSGLYDILPTGFTYFGDGTPLLDNDPELPLLSTSEFEWFPSNFMDYNSGALANSAALAARTLFGDGLDAGLRITFDDLEGNTYTIDDPLNNPGDAGADGVAMPHERVEQHVRHTQRFIDFELPARPDDITVANAFIDRTGGMPYVPAFNTAGLQVVIENVRNADLNDTYGPGPVNELKRTSSLFYWIEDSNVYFEIIGAAADCVDGTAIVSVMPSTSAGAGAYIYSWAAGDIRVFVDNKEIPAADILAIVPDPGGFHVTFIEFGLGSLPAGFFGQKDVTVVLRGSSGFNPVGRDLYSTMKNGIYVPPSAANWRTYARVVEPRTVPATPLPNEQFQVRVLGSGIAGPYPRNPSSNWPWTDVELRWDTGVLSLASVPAAQYTVFSFYEALFTVFDVTAYGVPTSSPGNVNPVDVALVTYDGCTGLPVEEDVIRDGIIFWENLPRIIATNVSPRTVESGAGGLGAPGTFTVGTASWEPGALGGHYLIDSAFRAFMIQTNTDTELTLYGGSPASGAWRVERGAYPLASGMGGSWSAASQQFTAVPDPGWGALAGMYLVDVNNNSFLIRSNTSNTLTLNHTDSPPANGGWRIVEPVHWGPVSGGDVLNIEGADFPMAQVPLVRIGPVEARLTTYNSGFITVRTPPAPFELPATYEVSSVWRITPAGNTQPAPVEARAPESEWFTYIMDGFPKIVEIEPNQIYVNTSLIIEPMQDPEQFITITGYNFDDRVIVTFTFTDESSAVPTTAQVEIEHFSVSPNMIVIRAADFMSLLSPLLHPEPDSTLDLVDNLTGAAPPDGLPDPTSPGNHYRVQVTVTNYVDDPGALPGSVNNGVLTSNPDTILYVVDNDDLMDPSDADLLFNDVYLNYRDYVNVNPGTGSIAKDPMLLPEGAPSALPWWRGKLEVVGDGALDAWGRNELNPMRDKAGKYIERPFTEADYELEGRPDLGEPEHVQGTGVYSDSPRLPDIGADEIQGGAGGGVLPSWYYAEVVPDPVPGMEPGELQVQIRVYDIAIPADPVSGEIIVYIVPQGVEFFPGFVDTSRCIAIELEDYGEGIYFGTNVDPITTIIEDVDGSGTPTQGDYLADGHAVIVIPLGIDGYLGDDPDDLTDGGLIVEQAVLGRHFLIDTIPPRPVLTVAPAQPSNIMRLENLGGPYAAQGVALPDPLHPYDPILGAWRPLTEASPPGGPFDQLLEEFPTVPPAPPLHHGTQAFFNVASFSNGYIVPENLEITIGYGDVLDVNPDYGFAFIDEPPKDAVTGAFIEGEVTDLDYWTNETTREVSGFPETLAGAVTQSDYSLPPTVALFSDSTYVPAIGELTYDYVVSSQLPPYDPGNTPGLVIPNRGFNRDNPNGSYVDYENNVVASAWSFNDGGAPGINYGKVASGAVMHMGMQFVAVDLAGNVTGLGINEGDALDPLHVWWMTRAETLLLPNIDGEEVGVLPFYWYLNRATSEDPEAQDAEVQPRFIWRLWYSDAFDGIYVPAPPYDDWSAWTTETELATLVPDLAEDLRADYDEAWFLLVVLGVDEAGNYEQWPVADLALGGGGEVEVLDRTRSNWVRFFLTGGDIETTLAHELWHNESDAVDGFLVLGDGEDQNFGAVGAIPLHRTSADPRVEGLFRIGVVLPPSLEGEDIAVLWTLQRDGEVIYERVLPGYSYTDQNQTLQLPWDVEVTPGTDPFLDDIPPGQDSVAYVLNAQAFWDKDNSGTWDPPDPSDPTNPEGERIDTTPASVHFRVLRDETVGGYIGRMRQRGKQQIILREE